MFSFLQVFFWGLCILVSFFGWGALVTYVLKFSKKVELGWQGIIGLCLAVIFGGVVNLMGKINADLLFGFVLTGLTFFLVHLVKFNKFYKENLFFWFNKIKKDKILILLFFACVFTIFIKYTASISFSTFVLDDQHGYMVFPVKMIETGSLGDDPFSERRVVSSLGGKYFLDTFILAKGNLRNLHLMDSGIGLILVLLLVAGIIRNKNIDLRFGLLVLFLIAFMPSPVGNITSFYIAFALFLAVLHFLTETQQENKLSQNILFAILISTICTLKSTFVFPSVILFVGYFLINFKKLNFKEEIKNSFFTLFFLLFFLLPWMIAAKYDTGTFFYPFLGKGYQGSVYGTTFLSHYLEFNLYSLFRLISEIIAGLGILLPFTFLFVYFYKNKKDNKFILVGFIASLVGILAMIYGIGGYSLYGYISAFVMPVVIFSVLYLFEGNANAVKNKDILLAFIIVFFMFGFYTYKNTESFKGIKSQIISQKYNYTDNKISDVFFGIDLISRKELEDYKNLQLSVPEGETILARLDKNYVFNFRRNQIYIIDIPGGASLYPGMPSFEGSEKLAEYFVSKGINYVAYSYGNEANFKYSAVSGMLYPHVNPLLRTEVEHSLDFQDNLMGLYNTREVVYDDGKNLVLDLSKKK